MILLLKSVPTHRRFSEVILEVVVDDDDDGVLFRHCTITFGNFRWHPRSVPLTGESSTEEGDDEDEKEVEIDVRRR